MNRAFLPVLLIASAYLAGCVEDQPERPRRAIPSQPKDVQPTKLGVWAALPEDTDANGYRDSVNITVYLSSDAFPATIAYPGCFDFRLMDAKGKEIAKWHIPEEKSISSARRMPAGPAYFFRLSMLDVGTDVVDASNASLAAEFHPRTGEPVSAPLTSLQFGKSH